MVIINKEEVVEITANLLCGCHCGIDVEFLPLRECREHIRQHIRLNFSCTLKFGTDTLLLCSNLRDMLNIADRPFGKSCKGLRQYLYLITRAVGIIHFKCKVCSAYFVYAFCHMLDRLYDPACYNQSSDRT